MSDPFQSMFATVAQTLTTLRDQRVLPRKECDEFYQRFMALRQALESGTADPDAWMAKFETACDELTQAAEEAQALKALDVALFDVTEQIENNQAVLERKFYELTGAID